MIELNAKDHRLAFASYNVTNVGQDPSTNVTFNVNWRLRICRTGEILDMNKQITNSLATGNKQDNYFELLDGQRNEGKVELLSVHVYQNTTGFVFNHFYVKCFIVSKIAGATGGTGFQNILGGFLSHRFPLSWPAMQVKTPWDYDPELFEIDRYIDFGNGNVGANFDKNLDFTQQALYKIHSLTFTLDTDANVADRRCVVVLGHEIDAVPDALMWQCDAIVTANQIVRFNSFPGASNTGAVVGGVALNATFPMPKLVLHNGSTVSGQRWRMQIAIENRQAGDQIQSVRISASKVAADPKDIGL